MAIKTMNLAKLPVWIIVMIQIFLFGAGAFGKELFVVQLTQVYDYKRYK